MSISEADLALTLGVIECCREILLKCEKDASPSQSRKGCLVLCERWAWLSLPRQLWLTEQLV